MGVRSTTRASSTTTEMLTTKARTALTRPPRETLQHSTQTGQPMISEPAKKMNHLLDIGENGDDCSVVTGETLDFLNWVGNSLSKGVFCQ